MKQELQDQLRAKHPAVFASCEISVGDGWFELLLGVATRLEALDATLSKAYAKLGTLRLGIRGKMTLTSFSDICHSAYESSQSVCEECGEKARMNDHYGYYKVTCPEHYLETKRKQDPKRFAKDHAEVIEREKRRKKLVGFAIIYQGKTVYVDPTKEGFARHSEALSDLAAKLQEHGLHLEE